MAIQCVVVVYLRYVTVTKLLNSDALGVAKITRRVKPKLNESIKWKNPYFENNGAVLKLFVAKKWIDIFIYREYELVEFEDMFRKNENSKMRAIKIESEHSFNYDRFEKMVKIAVKLNQK